MERTGTNGVGGEHQSWLSWAAMLLLGLLLCGVPLAYGGVDRSWQLVFAGVFALGALVTPVRVPALPRWVLVSGVVAFVMLALKDFVPAAWSGRPRWREIVEGGLGYPLGGAFAASPALSLHAVLVLLLAVCFVLWVRSLACGEGAARRVLVYVVVSACLVALVSFFMQAMGVEKIYGVRAFDGWQGFGPFPNRNHTACLLAMGAVVSVGLVWHAWLHRSWLFWLWGGICVFLSYATLASKSRGGVVAMGVGMVFYGVVAFLRCRSKGAVVGGLVGAVLLAGGLFVFFGGDIIERFTDPDKGGDWATGGRLAIWPEVVAYWWDSPWFGHGLNAFPHTFPFYQVAWMDNRLVIHPESSWLLFLSEWGALPLVLALGLVFGAGGWFLKKVRLWGRRELALRTGAVAGIVVIAMHSLMDVPAHRWGTAVIALALVAIMLRPNKSDLEGSRGSERASWFARIWPLAVSVFWVLSLLPNAPAWSPLALERFFSSLHQQKGLNAAKVDSYLKWYPLDPRLHELAGALKIRVSELREDGWKHLRIVQRLMPNSWAIAAQSGILASGVDADMAAAFWGEAVRRAGTRSYEVMRLAFQFTPATTENIAFWRGYARVNPRTLLTLAEILPDEDAKPLYEEWMLRRGHSPKIDQHEVDSFYRLVSRLGTRDDLLGWIESHIERADVDQRRWVEVLAAMGAYRAAWNFLEPLAPFGARLSEAGAVPGSESELAVLQATALARPDDELAFAKFVEGLEVSGRRREAVALLEKRMAEGKLPGLMRWKLAFLRAEAGDYQGAVAVASDGH